MSISTDAYYKFTDELDSKVTTWILDGTSRGLGKTATWPLMRLGDALLVCGAYLGFVLFVPSILRILKIKLTLYPLLFSYNFVQVMLCSYMSIEALLLAKRNNYSILVPCCNKFDAENPKVSELLYIFYISKILDFVDTFAIVMRGKGKQLSLLHVYHHVTIFLMYWLNMKVCYDGDIFFTILLNAFIHAIMYTYYFITLQIPKKGSGKPGSVGSGKPIFSLWWKKYTTQLQMLQFSMMISQAVYSHFMICPVYSKRLNLIYLFYIISLFLLFANFYSRSYSKKSSPKNKKKNKKN